MNDNDKLSILKTLAGLQDVDEQEDAALSDTLTLAGAEIINRAAPYDKATGVPEQYEMLQIKIALYLWNKRGAEGQTSHSENGISRSYGSADIPDEMFSQIVPMVGVL